jgi:hypothetical protein
VRSFCQENDRNLAVRRNPVSDCADGVAIRPGGVPARLGGEEFLYCYQARDVRRLVIDHLTKQQFNQLGSTSETILAQLIPTGERPPWGD